MTDNPTGDSALLYLGAEEARAVEAIAERLIPGDELGPGARDAGVATYIDRALAGFSRDLQLVYRLGLRELADHCSARYGAPFADLDAATQDEVVRRWLGPESPPPDDDTREDLLSPGRLAGSEDVPESPRLTRLFAVIREHAVEGFFCDPGYGGNRDAVGWRLVNFPGAQWGYTDEQMRPGYDASRMPIVTLGELRRRLAEDPDTDGFTGEWGR